MLVNGRSARQFCSQGQVRTAALALKLADREIHRNTMGEYPIMLLDDVLSELDLKRQQALTEQVEGQVLLTTATKPPKHLKASCVYRVFQGEIME